MGDEEDEEDEDGGEPHSRISSSNLTAATAPHAMEQSGDAMIQRPRSIGVGATPTTTASSAIGRRVPHSAQRR